MPERGDVIVVMDMDVQWRVPDLNSPIMNDGWRVYTSPSFEFGGEGWHFFIYPNGSQERNTKGYVDIGLCRRSFGPPLPVQFAFLLKTANGQKDIERRKTGVFKQWDTHSIHGLFSRTDYGRRKSELCISGHVTFVCTIKIFSSGTNTDDKCFCCKENMEIREFISLHEKCLERPITCPDCSDVFLFKNWLYGHECLKETTEEISQLKEQSLALSQELETKNNEIKRLESEILMMEKKLCKLQSTAQDDTGLNNEVERKVNEGAVEVTAADININDFDKPEIPQKNEDKAFKKKESVSTEDIVASINCLLKERKSLDVTFVLDDDKEVFAHKLILSLRSSFFGDEFYSKEISREHTIISLKGVDWKAFEKMIGYCYDYQPVLKMTEEACALLKISLQFGVISLVNVCRTFLKQSEINPGTVFDVLEVSEQIEDKSLMDRCLKVLQEKTSEVMTACELINVTPSMVRIILDLPKVSLNSEYELISWIFEWAKINSKEEDSICENSRDYLKNFLQDINFLSFTAEEFGTLCQENIGFFRPDEEASIMFNIVLPGMRAMPDFYGKDLKTREYTRKKA